MNSLRRAQIKTSGKSPNCWRNESEAAVWHNVTFQRTYRDEKGEIQNTSNFRMDDLPALAFLALKAYDQMASADE